MRPGLYPYLVLDLACRKAYNILNYPTERCDRGAFKKKLPRN